MAQSPADNGPRYAIYFVPAPASQLYRYGSSVLGYDSYTGNAVAFPDEFGAVNWNELTATPRRYGFHATLKAPFRLAPSCSEQQLINALRSFSGLGHAVHSFTPALRELEDFVAIVPSQVEELTQRACRIVHDDIRRLSRADIAAGTRAPHRLGAEPEFRFRTSIVGVIPTCFPNSAFT